MSCKRQNLWYNNFMEKVHNKQNYQKMLLDKIESIKKTSHKPSLLLHVCCAPCSSACLEILEKNFDITLLFYNPNIHPKEEYYKRLDELNEFVEKKNILAKNQKNIEKNQKNSNFDIKNEEKNKILDIFDIPNQIKILDINYDPNEFFSAIKGLEKEKEGGERCKACFNLRLGTTAKIAKEKKFDFFTTTLTLSPYKNSQLLNEIGEIMQNKYATPYLFSDFKKNDGYKKSIELSKEYNLYRQDYCGCVFSKKEREEQKTLKLKENKKL